MPCGIACQRRLIRMDIQLFFPDQLRTNLLCFLLEGSVICFQKLHRRLVVQTSNFAFDHAAFRNDVGTGAAADFSDVGSGTFIHVALRKLCDCVGGRLDAVDAVLRVETGVGGFPWIFAAKETSVGAA